MEEYWNPLVPELSVFNLADSLDFYQSLGFRVRFRRSDPDFAYIELGQAQLMLETLSEDSWQTGSLERPFGRGINLQIEVPNVRDLSDHLKSAGAQLFEDLTESWYATGDGEEGQLEFLIQDPDGYLIRLIEPLGFRPIET